MEDQPIKPLEELFPDKEERKLAEQLLKVVPKEMGRYPFIKNRGEQIAGEITWYNTPKGEKAQIFLIRLAENNYIKLKGYIVKCPLYSIR